MKPDIRDLYHFIGSLFYAIGVGRGVTAMEINELKEIVGAYWLPRNIKVSSREWQGHAMLQTMDVLQIEEVSEQEAYRDFERFFRSYPEIFSLELKEIILDTARDILGKFGTGKTSDTHIKLSQIEEMLYPLRDESELIANS